LKKREALLLNSYNLRNVVNNSLSLSEVLTFYFGSAVGSLDILAARHCRGPWKRVIALPSLHELLQRLIKKLMRHKFDVYANVNIL